MQLSEIRVKSKLVWLLVALVGATGFAMLALSRGEQVNAVWLVLAAVSCYAISYRFYSKFIAERVLQLDDGRMCGGCIFSATAAPPPWNCDP